MVDVRAAVLNELHRHRQVAAESVVVLRTELRHGRQLVAVECDSARVPPARLRGIFAFNAATPSEAEGSYIGGADASLHRSAVWSNYGQFSAGDFEVMGGWTVADAAEVELVDGTDRRIRERVESGVVMFGELRDSFGPAIQVILLDESGKVLRQEHFPSDEA
jgi:hypothetical protein